MKKEMILMEKEEVYLNFKIFFKNFGKNIPFTFNKKQKIFLLNFI